MPLAGAQAGRYRRPMTDASIDATELDTTALVDLPLAALDVQDHRILTAILALTYGEMPRLGREMHACPCWYACTTKERGPAMASIKLALRGLLRTLAYVD